MAIEVFMKVARATAAHFNPQFQGRAIYPSSRRNEKCHPFRIALGRHVLLLGGGVAASGKLRKGNCPAARVVTPLQRHGWRILLR